MATVNIPILTSFLIFITVNLFKHTPGGRPLRHLNVRGDILLSRFTPCGLYIYPFIALIGHDESVGKLLPGLTMAS